MEEFIVFTAKKFGISNYSGKWIPAPYKTIKEDSVFMKKKLDL